ncbi:MAG: S1-like domain-containing RNA-binding protein [Methylobacter sp.]|nr:S1-like domain-containing RNA-binding protein [Methylobacter sp.]MDP2097220.1 S1-like domain-containing RNA-binding protein [Methylobacter sp.]MDP2430008.1 S1-like domain-containing RNA-binding protein [Methylobacter sp.]MDP3054612.1 S1-like domain-containing RNA-binding protein [Methylobacter sp.]MDP3362987.1 S1-like domain-containing RNA-binding protein [Methylobacter sp.]
MINIGKINKLNVVKQQGADVYLDDGTSGKVLLADRRLPANCEVGDSLDVFVYVDSDGHLAATSRKPLAQVGDIAWLKVVALNYVGAFLDWGLPKDLLVPFSEQYHEMEVGRSYLVRVFLDEQNRIAATTKIDKTLSDESVDFEVGQKVSLIIAGTSDLGIKAIINNSHWGMLYQNELYQPVKKGQKLDGYIKQIREDQKIDLSLQQPGYGKVVSLTDSIIAKLKANDGELMLSDKSPPEAIYAAFGVSKKVFKQAIGALYKQQVITMDKTGIKLVD